MNNKLVKEAVILKVLKHQLLKNQNTEFNNLLFATVTAGAGPGR